MVEWRRTKEYRLWKIAVIRRDKQCVICGSKVGRHAHHINHATYFPDQRFDVDNGVCLCDKCHMNFHCNFMRSYRSKCERADFLNYIVLIQYIITLTVNITYKNE